jgi:hypothetical protein
VVEPTTVYLENWHIDLIAEHFEAIRAGLIKRFSSTCRKIDVHWVFGWTPNPRQRRDAPARSFPADPLCRHPSHSSVYGRFRATVRHPRARFRRVVQGSVDKRPCRSLRSLRTKNPTR